MVLSGLEKWLDFRIKHFTYGYNQNKKITLLLFLCCCAFAQQTVSSQTENRDSLTTVEISMYDGNIFLGDIIAETESEYTLRTKSGIEIQIPKSRVKEIVEMTITEVKGEVYRPDPNKSMYLFAPSAFPIEHDKSYCRDFCYFSHLIIEVLQTTYPYRPAHLCSRECRLKRFPLLLPEKFLFLL